MTNSNLKFKPVLKDRFFYNYWQYSISFHLREAHGLRHLDHRNIDIMLDWISTRTDRWQSSRAVAVTPAVRAHLHSAVDFFTDLKTPHKLTVTTHRGIVFTNDPDLVDLLRAQPGISIEELREARINRPPNTILITEPRHTHRSYLKTVKLTREEKARLEQYFLNQPSLRLSPGLIEWFSTPYVRLQDYYFIDHNGSGDLVMLSLVLPGLIRKTLEIRAR